MDVKQMSVFMENKPGKLNEFTKILQKHNINMRALCLAEISDYGVLRVIVDDTYELSQILRDEGYIFKATPVLAVEIIDEPGSLVKILDALEAEKINVSYAYAFTAKTPGVADIILRVDDNDAGGKALRKAGIRTLSQEDLEKLQ